jgi:TusA-related sulfurtransferase
MKKEETEGYTLDIDATGIEAEKESAKVTYKGYKGYMPIVGHLAENGLIIGDEFREGNVPPSARNLEFIKRCMAKMPEGKTIEYLRADSASYQADIINFCEKKGIQYVIGADLDKAVVKVIEDIPEKDWKPYKNGSFIAQTVHSMNKTDKAFRLIVIRRPYQKNLFHKEEDPSIKYVVRATNMEGKAEDIIARYNKRGEHSENRIKDLKIGFGMERMPCGQTEANAVFFRIGVLAYNLFRLFTVNTLEKSWHKSQVQTIRWKLYQIAGKIVYHSNQIFLKVHRRFCHIFNDIRLRIWEFAKT